MLRILAFQLSCITAILASTYLAMHEKTAAWITFAILAFYSAIVKWNFKKGD
jgi:hypothetical protein